MRASELLGLPVFDPAGSRIGLVADLRCTKEAAPGAAWGLLRLESLVVDRRRAGARLGYDRQERSPALIRGIIRRLHGQSTIVAWSQVAGWSANGVRLR
jgi:hypothetical protein